MLDGDDLARPANRSAGVGISPPANHLLGAFHDLVARSTRMYGGVAPTANGAFAYGSESSAVRAYDYCGTRVMLSILRIRTFFLFNYYYLVRK